MIRLFRHYISPRKAIFIIGEGILIFLAVSMGTFIVQRNQIDFDGMLSYVLLKILLITIIAQISLYFNDLYESNLNNNPIDLYARLLQAIGITSIILAVVYFIWPQAMIGRWIYFVSIIFLILFLVSWRILYNHIVRKRFLIEKAVIIGDGELARNLIKETKSYKDINFDIRCMIGKDKGESLECQFEEIPVRFGFHDLCTFSEAMGVSNVIVALDQKRGVMPYKELLNCKMRGLTIIDGESYYERITGKLLVEKINPSWLIFSDGFEKSRTKKIVKRLFDLILAAGMLLLLSPLMLLIAVLIKMDTPGPVIFSQERVGEFEEPFTLLKFRSMKADAEKETGPVWATEQDPRITRFGKVLRKLRFDELPQLWNVFKGEMSFVGPRPERAFFVEKLKERIPYYNERFTVKPGVTGWAQVKFPYGSSEKDALEKLKYDLYYIKNMSLFMDLTVIFQTVKTVLLGRGAR